MRFVGAWDTVDAYGLPFDGLKALAAWATQLLGPFSWVRFADRSVSPHVDYAAHALSLDDARRTFHPVLWDERTAETADGGAMCRRDGLGPPRVHASVTERVRRSRCDLAPDVLLPEFVVVDDDGSGTLHPAVAPPTLAFVHTLRLVF